MKYGFINQKCPKCGGNIFRDSDRFGWYEHCLQCGYIHDIEHETKIPRELVEIAFKSEEIPPLIRELLLV